MTKKKKDKKLIVRLDEELYEQAHDYSQKRGFSLSSLIRAFLRIQTDPEDPREPPPGIEDETAAYLYRHKRRQDDD